MKEPGEIDELDELHIRMLLNLDHRFPRTNRIPLLLRYGAQYCFNYDRQSRASFLAAIKINPKTTTTEGSVREGRCT